MATIDTAFGTKILVPRRQDGVICRQRLLDLLHARIHLRVHILSAPAGYGKTTLLVDLARDIDIPVCWYSLDVADQDPKTLLEGIIASIRFRFLNFGRLTESRLLATTDIEKEAEHLVGTLTGEMETFISDYFLLVLEDFHFVEDSESTRRLADLIVAHAPDNCHIVISSRTPVTLPAISKLSIQRKAARLDTRDLSFSPMEVKELLARHHGHNLSDAEAEKLATDTEGWIIAILLSAYSLQADGITGAALPMNRQDVFRYLASEVYERQPSYIQRFLLASSTLDSMDPETCDGLLGLVRSRKLLHELARRNLFTQCIDSQRACFRYHHLFREFLQARLAEENPEEFVFLHFKAGSLFEREGQWAEAIAHFLKARKYEEAVRVIKTVGEDFHKSGKWTTVSGWLQALPRDMRQSDPGLVLLHARSLIHMGEADQGGRMLTGLLSQLVSTDDWLGKAKALSWRSAAFRLLGHSAGAKSDAKAAMRLLEEHNGPADVLADTYNRLGNIYAEKGQFRVALRLMRRALKCYTAILDTGQMAAVHNSLGIMYKRLGDLARANVHFERAREGWQMTENYASLALTLNNIGIVYQRQGQYDLALTTLRSGLEKARETGYRRAEALILGNLADLLRDLDLYDRALQLYQEDLEVARQVMEPYYVAWATAGMGETYRLLGAHGKAEVLLKEAISQVREQGQTYETALFATRLGIIEYERGEYATAVATLGDACERLKEVGDKDGMAKAYFHLAQASFLAKKYDTAIDYLEKVSVLADELGYDDFLTVEARNSALLLQYAASKKVRGDRFVRIIDKIRKRRASGISVDQLPAAPQAPSRPDIEAHALGESSVLVNSHPVSDAEWRSSRAKELFFYMLCCRLGQTREQVATAVWPDLSPAQSSSNFHINLYRARRAVSPVVFTLEQGRYKINPDLNIWFDATEFEGLLSRAQNSSLDSTAKMADLERAIQLYKGPFLQEFYSEWTEVRRRELEDEYLKALWLLAGLHGAGGSYDKAVNLVQKYIAVDPYQEEAYCRIMEWQLKVGDKASALRTYKWYLDNIAGDEKLSPSTRAKALYNLLLS